MWVRSQSKYTLINTNIIRICEDDRDDCGDYLICAYSDGYDHELGVYSSFEKALKVLDEIQKAIENTNYYSIDNFCLNTYALKRGAQVYQMPQDEDVEIL
jgi:hypothetical protein